MENSTERTVRGEDIKIYRTRTVLADIANTAFKHASLFSRKPTRVYSSDGRHLGHAHVFKQNGQIVADIQIDYACEERLLAETQAERRWAWMIGKIGFAGGYRTTVSENGSAGVDLNTADPYIYVDEIVLSATPPSHPETGVFGT